MRHIFTTLRLPPTIGVVALLLAPLIARAQAPLPAAQATPESITLEEAIRAAVANPAISSARERASAARGALRTARTWSNPTLTYQVENAPLPRSSSTGLEREESVFAMLPLEPLYQLGPRTARARSEVLSTEHELSDTKRITILATSSAFFRAGAAQVAVRSAENVSSWLDSLVVYTGYRVREGAAAEADLLRLQVEQGRAEVDRAVSGMDLGRELAELSSLTGIEAGSVSVELPDSAAEPMAAVPSLDSLTALALAHRADLAAASARVNAASAGVSIERRAILREVGVMAGVKRMDGQSSLMAGMSVPVPLFDRNTGEIQRARAEERVAVFDRELVQRRVVSDIRTAYAATVSLDAALRKTRNLVSRAQESRGIAEAAYREGAMPLSQVIDAARALADASQAYSRAYFGWKQSLLELTSSTLESTEVAR